jgi:hypothetical protein
MQKAIRIRIAALFSALLLLFGSAAWAQQLANRPRQATMRTLAYDAAKETVVEGTVVSYTAESTTPPMGAHFILQTAAGAIDIHLGAASFLQANHFSLATGDTVRVVGVSSATRQGTVLLARVIQKAGQSLVLRTARGAPLSLVRTRTLGALKTQQQEGAR